ncbi:MAG: tetratricopeptide repeat protein [Proteobacteria bacterium]|nr:tetratricopeptide repeat protein [Pseudomonadota bacterium]
MVDADMMDTEPNTAPCPGSVYDAFATAVLAHDRAVVDRLKAVLDLNPDSSRAWAAKAILTVMLARSELLPAAREAAATARRCRDCNGDDAAYVKAAEVLVIGNWSGAVSVLERLLERSPNDSLAAKLSHGLQFMLGDATGMLHSISMVMNRLEPDHPHAGFLFGCQAFALEENHRFAEAERIGRVALERTPQDAWGMHAVSHVYEMTGRAATGIAWIDAHPEAVWNCNNFRFHLFWHKALFLLDVGDVTGALECYDHFVRAERTDDFRDIANATSFLKRIELLGKSAGSRWEELADICVRRIEDRTLVFADLHYGMALAGAGRVEPALALAKSLQTLPAQSEPQTVLAKRVGARAAGAIIDHARGRYSQAAEKLHSVQPHLQLLGGSNAQRDIFEQIMLDAMVRSNHPEAPARLASRLARRHGNNAFASALLSRHGRAGHQIKPRITRGVLA